MVKVSTTISFYDFLNKFITGFLLLIIGIDILSEELKKPIKDGIVNMENYLHVGNGIMTITLIFATSFIFGIVFSFIVEKLTLRIRNCPCLLEKARKKAMRESSIEINLSKFKTNILYDYYRSYYKMIDKGLQYNVPALEATERFIKQLFFLIVLYLIPRPFSDTPRMIVDELSLILLLLLPFIWYNVQIKIHATVWEVGEYINILKSEESNK